MDNMDIVCDMSKWQVLISKKSNIFYGMLKYLFVIESNEICIPCSSWIYKHSEKKILVGHLLRCSSQ